MVWVQVWASQVPGSVQVEQSELEKVAGLESVKAMVPMLVEVEDLRSQLVWEKVKVQQLESALAQQSAKALEKAPMSEKAQESALSKGWGWVLGSAQQLPQQLQQEQHKPELDPPLLN
jgi:hypothetical protein